VFQKIIKTFLIEDFLHLPPVLTTPVSKTLVVHLELRISPQIFEKIQNGPTGVGAWGKLIHKKPEVENLVALFL
jgi:hypothetical protein